VLATPPSQPEPVERRTVDEFFKQSRKAAIYLIGHGPKREPRPVELQYMRVNRYIGMLREAGSGCINISREPYVDLNMRRYEYSGLADHFPQFETLLGAIHEYEVVFTDIVETRDPRDAVYYNWVRYRLEAAGARVENVTYEEEEWLKNYFAQHFGPEAQFLSYSVDDGSDLLCFFPAMAASILSAVIKHRQERENREFLERYHHLTRFYSESSPYRSGDWPFVEESVLDKAWELKRKKDEEIKRNRLEHETGYRIGLERAEPLLTERTPEASEFVEKRLHDLGFEKLIEDRTVTYRMQLDDNYVVIANPCKPERLEFTAFRKRVTSGKRTVTKFEKVYPDFYILDKWKHNLCAKLQEWLDATLAKKRG
jgi:hypothetical protein